jgi:hypothetical protein
VNFWRISKWKAHIASALAARGSTTEHAGDNYTAESLGTLCIGNGSEAHKVKNLTSCVGTCEM